MPVGRWPLWLVVGLVTVAYWVGASMAFLGFGASSIVVLFLPAGVTLSALVLNPRRRWPWILAAVAVTEVVVDLSHGLSPRWVWGFALANTAEPLVGALLLGRYVSGPVNLLHRRDVVAFLGCCVVAGPAVGGVIGATTLALSLDLAWPQSYVSFWAGDATGVLTVAGCILSWRRGRSGERGAARWTVGAVLAVAAAVVTTVIGFWPHGVPLFYLPIPVLFWLAFSQRLAVTLTGGLAVTITANLMTNTGHGPWAALGASDQWRTLALQLFLASTILGAWALAVGVAERDQARSATSAERAARRRLNALQALTADLAKAATSTAVAKAIVREGIRIVADHGSIAIASADGREVTVWASAGRPAQLRDRYRRVPIGAIMPHTHVIRTGEWVVHQSLADIVAAFPEVADACRTLDVHSTVCVPVRVGVSPPLGSLAFSFHRENAAGADVLAFAEALAGVSGHALRRAQAYEREVDAAQQLQHALLPVLPGGLADIYAGVRVGAAYRSADLAHQVGGDWYDAFPLAGERVGFAVGDVVGHHLVAAAAMVRLQSAIRILAQSADDPAQVLDDLDRASGSIADSSMATVGFADYDVVTRTLRYACAGHPPPLLVSEGRSEYLWDGRSVPLGLRHTPARRHGERVVPDGATLIWYTDGLIERPGEQITTNLRRLADAVVAEVSLDPDALCRHLLHRLAGDGPLTDDTVVLCVRFVGGA